MVLKGCNCLDTFNKQDLAKAITEPIIINNRKIDFIRTKAPATKQEKEFVVQTLNRH